ncbi:DivIVA domain-containing protein [Amycolatopsis sp. H20-H5]|uniref:DivIVA domain-containing protein n=1 Tax=Amycolatopsis sp. H20-H5 TaxID=3046309 RepID=UPI002DB9D10B|nr:DivIVA domain-containing protein [Amycolatopsis sp. H20-H5]MEC3975992.1 DivIVA domain-containing protein [Amycolatopsis sp. H20-H5]
MGVSAIEARTIQFDRAPIGTRGYDEPSVDAFLDRVADTLDGQDDLTASDVHDIAFAKSPLSKRGYDPASVDTFLRHVESTLAANTLAASGYYIAPALEHSHARKPLWRRVRS